MNKIVTNVISVAALIISGIALAMNMMNNKENQPVDVEAVILEKPEIIINAMQNYEQKMRENALAQVQKSIDENIEKINNDPNSPVIGNKDGKIVIAEFFDFSCGYCHALYPNLKKIIAKNPDVKVVLKEMAFLSPNSVYAAKAALAANMQGKYAEVLDAIMTNQGALSEAKIDELAVKAGVNLEQMKADMNSAKIDQIMKDNAELANKIQVTGVPALVINGKFVQTIDEAVIQKEVDEARSK